MDALLPIVPLIAASVIILGWGGNPFRIKYVAFAASLLSLLLTALIAMQPAAVYLHQWFSLGTLNFDIATSTMPINVMLLAVVSIITPLIMMYSMGYIRLPSEQKRFYFEMCIFAASMMLFAVSASLVSLFIAWEMLGITSYLLIGFWYRKEHAPYAARKAITTILIGDLALLAAIAIIAVTYHSFDYSTILANPGPALYLPLVLILIAAFTKSAQFPFHEWLSDAMEGPTPVSAFLHSSTMVKAGVFLVILLLPLYAAAGMLDILLAIGLVSAIIGAANALVSRHIKKTLAYSTIEDLGLMFIALGLNAPYAAIMLFFVQSFYKALLFMGSGSIIRANYENEDIFKTFGSATRKIIFIPLVIGVLSIVGVFPLSGFFGKALVGDAAFQNILVYLVLAVIEFASSVYVFRWLFIPMRKYSPDTDGDAEPYYAAVPMSMVVPMIVLAVLVIGASAAYLLFPAYFSTLQAPSTPGTQLTLLEFGVVSALAGLGFLVANRIYRQNHRLYIASKHKRLFAALNNHVIANKIYSQIGTGFGLAGEAIGELDYAIDRATYSISRFVIKCGDSMRRLANGQINAYALGMVIGLALMVLFFVL